MGTNPRTIGARRATGARGASGARNARLQFVFLTLFILIAVTACEPIGRPDATETAVITVTEAEIIPVEVYGMSFDNPPEKVVSLSPAITEIIYELGAKGSLVGVGRYSDYPPEAMEENPDCGSAANPDFEKILALSPDLLITQSPIAIKDLTALRSAGIEVLSIPAVTDIESLNALYESLNRLFYGEEAALNLPALDKLNSELQAPGINIGSFVYYLTDDLTPAGQNTFPAGFFANFGNPLGSADVADGNGVNGEGNNSESTDGDDVDGNGADSEGDDSTDGDGTDGEDVDGNGADGEDNDGNGADGESNDGTDGEGNNSDGTDGNAPAPDTIILPDYLSYLTEGALADSPARIIILSPEATSLLERPTDRVQLVIDELREPDSNTETATETTTEVTEES
jgi:hypothetical protein